MSSEESQSIRRKRFLCLSVFLLSPFAFGVIDLIYYDSQSAEDSSYLISTIIGIFAIVGWVSYDAALRDYPLSSGLRWCVILLAVVGVPLYLVRTRGWKGAAIIGFGLPALLISMATYSLGYSVAWLTGSWRGLW